MTEEADEGVRRRRSDCRAWAEAYSEARRPGGLWSAHAGVDRFGASGPRPLALPERGGYHEPEMHQRG